MITNKQLIFEVMFRGNSSFIFNPNYILVKSPSEIN